MQYWDGVTSADPMLTLYYMEVHTCTWTQLVHVHVHVALLELPASVNIHA